MAAATQTACFSVDGEWLTDFCRSLVLEGRWRHALKTLVEGLDGMTTDQALSILCGEQWLRGVNDVEMLADDRPEAASYKEDLAWQYAGLWNRLSNGVWQPYAFVGAYSRQDLPPSTFPDIDPDTPLGEARRELALWQSERSMYYADDPKLDYSRLGELPDRRRAAILWRQVTDPPLWLIGVQSSEDALAESYAAGRHLDERGPHVHGMVESFPGEKRVRVPDYEAIFNLGPNDPTPPLVWAEATTADRIAAQLGATGKMVDVIHSLFGEQDTNKPEPDTDLGSQSGYILPDGTFYGCAYMHHRHLAAALLRWLFEVEVDDPQIEADRRNWLRIQATIDSQTNIMSPNNRPTKRQERTLVDWCVVHQVPYPEDLR